MFAAGEGLNCFDPWSLRLQVENDPICACQDASPEAPKKLIAGNGVA